MFTMACHTRRRTLGNRIIDAAPLTELSELALVAKRSVPYGTIEDRHLRLGHASKHAILALVKEWLYQHERIESAA